MKKLVVLAVLLMAVPALAAPSNVSISVTKTGPNEFTIGYNTDANLVRAFGLDIIVDDPCVSIDVDCTGNTDYDIYPGSITITAGVPGPWGQCDVATSDANHVIIEMGSLYEAGVDPAPATSGNLAVVTMTGCDSDDGDGDDTVTVKVEENALRGGVVMENVDEVPNLSSPGGTVVHSLPPCACFPSSYTTYSDWVALGKPDCWCGIYLSPADWLYQCDGDIMNDGQVMNWRVYTNDLTELAANWKKTGSDPTLNPCADIDHKGQVMDWRCYTNDLTIMANNWKKTPGTPPTGLAGDCPRPE